MMTKTNGTSLHGHFLFEMHDECDLDTELEIEDEIMTVAHSLDTPESPIINPVWILEKSIFARNRVLLSTSVASMNDFERWAHLKKYETCSHHTMNTFLVESGGTEVTSENFEDIRKIVDDDIEALIGAFYYIDKVRMSHPDEYRMLTSTLGTKLVLVIFTIICWKFVSDEVYSNSCVAALLGYKSVKSFNKLENMALGLLDFDAYVPHSTHAWYRQRLGFN